MPIAKVTDHAEQAEGLLLEQYRGKPRLAALLKSYVDQVQELEDAAWDVLVLRLIDNASGEQLDVIGRIVQEGRRDHDDAAYRVFLSVRIRVNRSKGYASDILQILALLDATTERTFEEHPPATMVFSYVVPPLLDPQEIFDMTVDAKGGGVGLVIISPTTTANKQFMFSDVDEPSDPDHGFGDVDTPDDFGLLSAVFA